ncbi:hypothetical protein K469DRAFT_667022 [Zopfia rhizophila CBS 207.26]|uniref:Shugoshin n=1 Tax=Zopfia rhizophila CBS 207.26 TaxID=1314779 RepID=A0A6A6E1U5_9PEZI|nr:hypothetical protein K469DRAFT_667022 [Zopfia rhizophila CBS 207.26]
MARLNDPPVAPGHTTNETVDAVKRRFLRQNRELAKTNSQQSIRIRNLETEGSRLLAENLSLREQVLQLQNALEAQSNRPSFENIHSVKDQLEAKIQELGSLVAELGQLKDPDTGPRCKSQLAATRRSPDERQWRSGLGLQEVENGMLPTIVEDKYYPRRTMNADELRGKLEDPDSQSPDLGPPPVSHFENEEPIAFNPSPPPEENEQGETEDPNPALSINLETRKKRRESNPKISIRRVSVFQSPPEDSEDGSGKGVRAGAKRKLSVREDDEKTDARAEPQAEAFRFSRRYTPSASQNGASNESQPSNDPDRPVLGSRPVNTDPVVSPKKQRASTLDKPDKKPHLTSKTSRGRITITRVPQPDLHSIQLPEPIPTTDINLDSLPPKTPAADDIFSPPSTEPSTSRPESKDTPPPSDLSSADQTGLVARPSRRARAQVNYKEPSLATKMRRPGKELADAVVPPEHGRVSVEPAPSTIKKSSIKREHNEEVDEAWKKLPTGNGGQDEVGEAGSPLREKVGRREGSQGAENGNVSEKQTLNSSAASNAISALIAGSAASRRKVDGSANKSKESVNGKSVNGTGREDKDNLAIFDFTDSSPTDPSTTSRPRIDLAKTTKTSRRHSSVPASSLTEERKASAPCRDGALPSLHSRTGSAGANGVRSVSSSSLTSAKKAGGEREVERNGRGRPPAKDVKEKKGGTFPSSGSNIDLRAAAEVNGAGTGNLRGSRRKSMML